MALNMSSNFSAPLGNNVTRLWGVNNTPFSFKSSTVRESLRLACAIDTSPIDSKTPQNMTRHLLIIASPPRPGPRHSILFYKIHTVTRPSEHTTEMIYHTQQMAVFIHDQNRMYLVIVHNILNLGNLGIRRHTFRRARHHLLHRDVKELIL